MIYIPFPFVGFAGAVKCSLLACVDAHDDEDEVEEEEIVEDRQMRVDDDEDTEEANERDAELEQSYAVQEDEEGGGGWQGKASEEAERAEDDAFEEAVVLCVGVRSPISWCDSRSHVSIEANILSLFTDCAAALRAIVTSNWSHSIRGSNSFSSRWTTLMQSPCAASVIGDWLKRETNGPVRRHMMTAGVMC